MATVKYRIKGKADPASIYIRLRDGRETDLEVSTGLKVPKKHWSSNKSLVKTVSDFDYAETNSKLRKLESFIIDQFNLGSTNGTSIDNIWLKNCINALFIRPNKNDADSKTYLVAFTEAFIEESKYRLTKKGTPLSDRVIKRYTSTKNHLIGFEESSKTRLRLLDINLKFHSRFVDYLSNKKHLNPNTVGRYIDDIKLFCRRAESKGLKVNPEYKHPDFHSPSNKTKDIYLTVDEINDVYNVDLSKKEMLDNARDWFIIGLWTGLRISDFLSLTKKNIEKGYFEVVTTKTSFPVIIPIHPQIKAILKKRNGQFPRKISHQKFNEYIKKVCELAEINDKVEGAKMVKIKKGKEKISRKKFDVYYKHELVSSHICRRSFATNHYGKLDTLTIMKITGHQTEKQFLEYIKVTPKEHAEKLKSLWDNLHLTNKQ
ncbi:MAG: phage integrase SAM-like domain-containing protein [Winogradskyella sp.]